MRLVSSVNKKMLWPPNTITLKLFHTLKNILKKGNIEGFYRKGHHISRNLYLWEHSSSSSFNANDIDYNIP